MSWLDKNRHIIFYVLLLVTIISIAVFLYMRQLPAGSETIEILPADISTATPLPTATSVISNVRVFISGAVVNPDVYYLPSGSIIKDVLLAAGGFTKEADRDRINQAQELKDQQHVHIPRIGDKTVEPAIPPKSSGSDTVSPPSSVRPVNLNTASLEQLDTLPGIGPAIAGRIIDYRETVGGFKSVEEITEVSGIGTATFNKIKDLIIVE